MEIALDYLRENPDTLNQDQSLRNQLINQLSVSAGPQAVFEEIVVNPSAQNSGIGKKLMSYSYNYLKSLGIKSIMLWAKNDEHLLNFYKKQEYFLADDFVVMFRNLN